MNTKPFFLSLLVFFSIGCGTSDEPEIAICHGPHPHEPQTPSEEEQTFEGPEKNTWTIHEKLTNHLSNEEAEKLAKIVIYTERDVAEYPLPTKEANEAREKAVKKITLEETKKSLAQLAALLQAGEENNDVDQTGYYLWFSLGQLSADEMKSLKDSQPFIDTLNKNLRYYRNGIRAIADINQVQGKRIIEESRVTFLEALKKEKAAVFQTLRETLSNKKNKEE